MKHTCNYRVMWQDTNSCREMTPSRLLTYMQETAGSQLNAGGIPLDYLRDERGLAFIVSRIALCQHAPLYYNDEIQVKTWISPGKGYSFDRFFSVHRGEELIAEAHTVWALLNLQDRSLVKNSEFSYGFEGDEPLQLSLSPRLRIPGDAEMVHVADRPIRYSDIDYNMHMNNCRYPDMIMDHVPAPERHRAVGLVLSFVNEAAYGENLQILRSPASNGYWFRTLNAEGKICLEAHVTVQSMS